jgi:hypothetical protein
VRTQDALGEADLAQRGEGLLGVQAAAQQARRLGPAWRAAAPLVSHARGVSAVSMAGGSIGGHSWAVGGYRGVNVADAGDTLPGHWSVLDISLLACCASVKGLGRLRSDQRAAVLGRGGALDTLLSRRRAASWSRASWLASAPDHLLLSVYSTCAATLVVRERYAQAMPLRPGGPRLMQRRTGTWHLPGGTLRDDTSSRQRRARGVPPQQGRSRMF